MVISGSDGYNCLILVFSNPGQRSRDDMYYRNYHETDTEPTWISNYIHKEVWGEITYPFPNVNGVTVEVWEWISNFSPHFSGHVITYPCWGVCILVANTIGHVTGSHC